MVWLQNGVSMLICFLLARMLMDRQILDSWLVHVLGKRIAGRTVAPDFLFLVISYLLSLFFSNTVVVLSLLPMVKRLMPEHETDKGVVSRLGLAIMYGANIGGMGSLVGSPINLAAATYLQVMAVPGAKELTFFSWLLLGLPISLVLLCFAWLIVRRGKPLEPVRPGAALGLSRTKRQALLGSALFLLLLLVVSALQFILRPAPLLMGLNVIDLFFLFLLLLILGLFLIWPLSGRLGTGLRHNLRFLGASLFVFPAIALNQLFCRSPFASVGILQRLRISLDGRMNLWWGQRFATSGQKNGASAPLQCVNPLSLVSLNRIFFDLPYLGFLLLGFMVLLLYLLMILGDNPATAVVDGWLILWINQGMRGLSAMVSNPGLLLGIFVFLTVFLTELLNNTVVLFVAGPLLLQSPLIGPELQLISFLVLTLAASAAFMSPVATPVNAIIATGLPGFSLKMMMARGFFLNVMAVVWLLMVAWLLSRFC